MPPRPSDPAASAATLSALLRERARLQGDARAFTFLADGETERETLSFAELERQARAVGALVQEAGASGERVLLLYPPGLDFVGAFFGCLAGGGVGVPTPAPPSDRAQMERQLPRLRAIARDSRPRLVLTRTEMVEAVRAVLPELLGDDAGGVQVLATDALAPETAERWREHDPAPEDLAFLQYTSGSTADPKGVMIRHGNLVYTCRDIDHGWRFDETSVNVSWTPIFHDMGLVCGVAVPVFRGSHSILMAPADFVMKPVRWLAAITRYRATHTNAPNFAYELAVRKVGTAERAKLDLSSLKVSLSSAEPVRWETIEAFTEAFEPCGFRRDVISPGFGLAESTVKVVSTSLGDEIRALALDADALRENRVALVPPEERERRRVQWYVGHGTPVLETRLEIVDPETRVPAAPDAVGEIWVRSPSVAAGYWNQPELTEETFGARLVPSGEGPFLRTGDLGFRDADGQLYVTGRIKDLIVLRGSNVYPQDVELTAERAHPAVPPGCSAACGVVVDGEEQLVVVAELDPRVEADPEDVLDAVAERIAEEHQLTAYAVLLVPRRAVPKTSSGKVQRGRCRALVESLGLEPVAAHLPRRGLHADAGAEVLFSGDEDVRAARLELHLAAHFAAELPGFRADAPDFDAPLQGLGLDFRTAARWSGRLAGELGVRLDGAVFFAPDLDLRHLARLVAAAERTPGAGPAGEPELEREAAGAGADADAAGIEEWLAAELAERLGLDPGEVDATRHFSHYGLDSLSSVQLAGALETWLGRSLPATLVWEHPTLRAAAEHLASERPAAGARPATPATGAPRASDEPIAVVGIGCRFPGAKDAEEFWELLREGRDAVTEVPRDRWDAAAIYDPEPGKPGRSSTRWGGFVDEVDRFDAAFFGISDREAARMDPQQRFLLEVAWEALEDAGIAPDRLRGSRTGVFVGISNSDWVRMQLRRLEDVDAYSATGATFSVAAGRLSYALDLRGPSVAVDTACSSSLVALHQARRSLLAGECELALAGGVNLMLLPEWSVAFSHARMMAADGRCKTFDAAADGYVRGEGCGLVALERLSDARAKGHRVLAVLRGSATNQDGHSNGLTAPNGPSQQAVIRAALADAGLPPSALSYVEAHGTGTPLGDPIELGALAAVLGPAGTRPVAVGSVKTNIGHLESAAGVAGLVKVVLALRHGEIPPHLHLHRLNPHVDLAGARIEFPTEARPWPRGNEPRRAGVSSFGFSGTNAHVVVEEAPREPVEDAPERRERTDAEEPPIQVACLSARTESALRALAGRLARRLAERPELDLADVAHTLAVGRAHLDERLAVPARSNEDLAAALGEFASGGEPAGLRRGTVRPDVRRRVGFLFTGQGSQHSGMGAGLYARVPAFREALEACCACFGEELGGAVRDAVLGRADNAALRSTALTQPAVFALGWALARTWRELGVEPAVCLGHSVGEITAAAVSGALRLEDACRLIAKRGELMGALPAGGAMVALQGDPALVERAVEDSTGRVDVAARNAPRSTVVSGAAEDVEALVRALEAEGLRATPLEVSHAFHSPLVEPMLDELEWFARTLAVESPRVPLVSNLTGRLHEGAPDAAYWRRHARGAVEFRTGVRTLLAEGCDVLLELGPHPVLLALARAELRGEPSSPVDAASLRRGADDGEALGDALAALHVAGVEVDWERVDRGRRRALVSLPHYPFARDRHWFEPAPAAPSAARPDMPTPPSPSDGALAQALALFREQTAVLLRLARGSGDLELEGALLEARGVLGGSASPSSGDAPPQAITPERVTRHVSELLARITQAAPDRIQPHTHLQRDLGLDSLMTVELDRRIHAAYPGIGDAEEMFTEDTTVQDLVDLVIGRLKERGLMDLMTEHQRTPRDYATYAELIAKDPSETYVGGAFKSETHTLHTLEAEGRRITGLMDVSNKYSGTSSFHLTQMGAYSFLVQLVQGYLCYKHGVTKEGLGMPKLNRIHMRWTGLVRTSTNIPAEVEERTAREEDGVWTVEFGFSIAGGAVTGTVEGFLPISSTPRPDAERARTTWATFQELIGMDPRQTYTGGTFQAEVQEIHDLHAEGTRLEALLDVENQFSGTPAFHLTQMGTYSYLVQLMLGYFCYKHGVVKDDLGMPTLEEFEIEWREMVTDSKNVRAVIEEQTCELESGRYRVEFAFTVGDDNGRGRLVGRIPVPRQGEG